MVLNRKAQYSIPLGIMLFVFALIIGIIFADPLSDIISEAIEDLECNVDGKSPGIYLTCIIIDIILPLFIGVIIFGSAAFLLKPGRG